MIVNGPSVKSFNLEHEEKEFVPIVKSTYERKDDGSFTFSYNAADGSYRSEVGVLRNAGTEDETLEVSGTYGYYDSDGQQIQVKYTAGRDGFVPEGTNIPAEIAVAARENAAYARAHPLEELKH